MNKYNRIMNKVNLSDEARRRILDYIARETVRKPFYIRYKALIAAAACFAVVLAGALTLPRVLGTDLTSPPNVTQGGYDAQECASLGELSERLGFEVTLPEEVPFAYESVEYCAMWSTFAEITWYSGGNEVACYRQQQASGDLSGDFNVYERVEELTAGGVTVTVKGGGAGWALAVWESGGMSRSLMVSAPLTSEQVEAFVLGAG